MQMAVIASEDQKFESHFGIDLQAIETALKLNAKSKKVRGGSTISQQTVKICFCGTGKAGYAKGLKCL